MKNIKHIKNIQNEKQFLENNIENISAMAKMLSVQQSIAFDITKLVLEHCVEGKITKEEVFDIYEEACDLLMGQLS